MLKPEVLKFATTHEWVYLEKDASGAQIATVGISAFALESLTDLVFIELPAVGRKLSVGETFGEVESVKAVSDLYSPVAGEVIAVHGEVANELEHLGKDPYGEGWLMRVKLESDQGLSELMDYAAYQQQCAEEGH